MRQLRLLLIMLAAHSMTACAGGRTYEWTEDVRLSNGSVIAAKRTVHYEEISGFHQGREASWLQKNSSIALPRSPSHSGQEFTGSLTPLAIDFGEDQSLYMVCIAGSGAAITEWRARERAPYVAFVSRKDAWQRIELSEIPSNVRPNLLVSTRVLFFEKGGRNGMHVSEKLKEELDSNPLIDRRFKSIQR